MENIIYIWKSSIYTGRPETEANKNDDDDDDDDDDDNNERECSLLVLNLVSSTPPCIRQPGPRLG